MSAFLGERYQVPGGADEWDPSGGGEMGSVDEADVEEQERSEVQERWEKNKEEASDTPDQTRSADSNHTAPGDTPSALAAASIAEPASASPPVRPRQTCFLHSHHWETSIAPSSAPTSLNCPGQKLVHL